MLTRLKFRRVLTGVTFISSLILGPIAATNVEELAKTKGWDQKLVAWWPDIMSVIETLDSTWTYVAFSFLVGATAATWAIRFIPEQAPEPLATEQSGRRTKEPTRKAESGFWRQTVAITDDNPEGEWEYVGDPDIASASNGLFRAWDGVDPLTMTQASFLWAHEIPADPTLLRGTEAQARYITLSQAVNKGDLQPVSVTPNQRVKLRDKKAEECPYLEIARSELIRFVTEKGLRPAPFLLKEDR